MKLRIYLLSVPVVLIILGTTWSRASAAAQHCSLSKRSTRVASTRSLVLYRQPTGLGQSYKLIGCLKSTGRRRVLDFLLGPVDQVGEAPLREPVAIRTAGRFVAFFVTRGDKDGSFDTSLEVHDLRRDRATELGLSRSGPGAANGLKLSANGRAVFVVTSVTGRPDPIYEVPQPGLWSVQGLAPALLEPGIGPFAAVSFTASGVRWTSPTGEHSAALRPN